MFPLTTCRGTADMLKGKSTISNKLYKKAGEKNKNKRKEKISQYQVAAMTQQTKKLRIKESDNSIDHIYFRFI